MHVVWARVDVICKRIAGAGDAQKNKDGMGRTDRNPRE